MSSDPPQLIVEVELVGEYDVVWVCTLGTMATDVCSVEGVESNVSIWIAGSVATGLLVVCSVVT